MRILFVGNSHTYANGLPFQVRALIENAKGAKTCDVLMIAPGGKSLACHAQEPATLLSIACGRWDTIVLQQQTHPFPGYQALAAAYDGLAPYLARSGAEVLLYVTWSEKTTPENQADIDTAFERLATGRGLRLAPVSKAWHRALVELPEVDLYASDGAHAGPSGSYLAACVFYGVLLGTSPEGAPSRIAFGEQVLADLTRDTANRLQRIAWWAVTGESVNPGSTAMNRQGRNENGRFS